MKQIINVGKDCLIIFLMSLFCFSQAYAQEDTDLPEELGTALGVYKIRSFVEKRDEFQNFEYFHLDKCPEENTTNPRTDKNRKVGIIGELKVTDGKIFKFEKAFLKRVVNGDYKVIYFITKEIDGISYSFLGDFLEENIFENGGYTEIKGKLTKYKNGKKVASHEFPFYENAQF